ncbi:MAG: nicotinamide-nucleotide amidohydrolase family protein [Anaerolineales bacterium]|nr:nicotinamide-nucleotide amidohydrolase family protein [Anaerolineales bacterium]
MSEALEVLIGRALKARGWTLATGESCTAGLVSHRITNVPGSSDYFRGGVVAYSNDAKAGLLGVQQSTLTQFGAISQETALEMARGARRAFQADVGVSVTGIAGPGGGTPEKPVGLTWIAVSSHAGDHARQYLWEGDREHNKAQSAHAALTLLWETLENEG